jgi:phosphoserine phosphatase
VTGAAFFDLDKTLIEGSSALHFGRAAYKQGLMSRGQLARDAWANIKFRLQGSNDADTDALRQRILDALAGQRVIDLQRLGPDVLAGILPLLYREVLREAYAHQDAGRRAYIVTAASQELAEVLAHVLVLDGGVGMRSEVRDGVYTGRPAGPFTYRSASSPRARASTSPSRTRTRTRSPICRCCARSAIRSRSTRTPRSRRSPARRGGASCASTGSRRS